MTTMTVSTHAEVFAPRGAQWAANGFAALLNWIEKAGQRRAQESEYATRIGEAARVRAFAQQVLAHDPRFASDLFAAADRHER